MNKEDFYGAVKSYVESLDSSDDTIAVVTTSGKEMGIKAKNLTDDYIEENDVEDIIVEDDLENILPGLIDVYNEEGIRRVEEDIFPLILHPYDDKNITLEIKLIGSHIKNLKRIDEGLGELPDIRFIRPGMNLDSYLLEIDLYDLEKYKEQFTDEEYSKFIDFVEDNIEDLVDKDDIIKGFIKRFHVEELTDPAND